MWLRILLGLFNMRLWFAISSGKKEIKRLATQRCQIVEVFHFGATYIHPKNLAFWIRTKSDSERDLLRNDTKLIMEFREALLKANYPADAVPDVGFAFESDETVERDYNGSWFQARK